MTHKGVPDFPRSARCILKDYVNGRLLYCTPPPDITTEQFKSTPEVPNKNSKLEQDVNMLQGTSKSSSVPVSSEIDSAFFKKKEVKMGIKGVKGVGPYSRNVQGQ